MDDATMFSHGILASCDVSTLFWRDLAQQPILMQFQLGNLGNHDVGDGQWISFVQYIGPLSNDLLNFTPILSRQSMLPAL